jgi:hypothetical protein
MKPVDYLIAHRDRAAVTRSDLARLFLEVGRGYGAQRTFNQADVESWFHFENDRPRWFHAAALDVALEHDWKIETLEDARVAVRTFRALDPHANLPALFVKLGAAVPTATEHQLVNDAWIADVLKKPARRPK